jgi:hypothetical protein
MQKILCCITNPLQIFHYNTKFPVTDSSCEQFFTAQYEPKPIEKIDSSYRFAAAVAMFGSMLKQSKFVRDYQYEDVLVLS